MLQYFAKYKNLAHSSARCKRHDTLVPLHSFILYLHKAVSVGTSPPLHDSVRGEPRVAPLVLSSTTVLSEHLRRDVGAQAAMGENANSALTPKNRRETPAGAASEEEEQQENNAQKWRVGDDRNAIILLPEAKYGHAADAGLEPWRLLQFRLPPLTIEGIHHSDADLSRGGAERGKIKNNGFAFM